LLYFNIVYLCVLARWCIISQNRYLRNCKRVSFALNQKKDEALIRSFRSRDDLKYLIFFGVSLKGALFIYQLQCYRLISTEVTWTTLLEHTIYVHVVTRRSINGRRSVSNRDLTVPFRRALSKDCAWIGRVSSWTVDFNRDRFKCVLSILIDSSSFLSCFS